MSAPRVRIVSTGSEILQGLYPDTNAQGLSRRLFDAGFRVVGHAAAPDDAKLIRSAVEAAALNADLVVMTGGLGPTEDDVNRDVIAALYGCGLRFDEEADRLMRVRFAARGIPMPERNRVQAMIPEPAVTLQNLWGTAPGFVLPKTGRLAALCALPGPPNEWRPMFEAALAPDAPVDGLFPQRPKLEVHTIHVALTPESTLNEVLSDLFAPVDGIDVTILASRGVIRLRIIGQDNPDGVRARRDEVLRRIGPEIVFGEGPADLSPAQALLDLFRERGLTLATAESCTGGWVAKSITDLPGSSAMLHAGWVTYANEAKIRDLRVPAELIAAHGAVSEPVARAMAEGARTVAGTNYAVAVTGIAGPDGGTAEKPVGTVWFACAGPEGTSTLCRLFRGDRDSIRQWATNQAIELTRRAVLGIPQTQYLGGANPRFLGA
ncbi:nicotinamide-nucleotide amidohydrolase family protein [bacterium]|nr:nicotinamide-nucleotide amidohydrolase family protein [bacterium]